MLNGIKERMMSAARSPNAERALFLVSFAESSFFPLPPDLLLGPMSAAEPKKWLRYEVVCTIADHRLIEITDHDLDPPVGTHHRAEVAHMAVAADPDGRPGRDRVLAAFLPPVMETRGVAAYVGVRRARAGLAELRASPESCRTNMPA